MTENEICREYRMAKNQYDMIGILADLNEKSVADVCWILKSHGYDIPRCPKNNAWKEEQEAQLVQMQREGKTLADMAAFFGRSTKSIGKKLERMNLVRRRET